MRRAWKAFTCSLRPGKHTNALIHYPFDDTPQSRRPACEPITSGNHSSSVLLMGRMLIFDLSTNETEKRHHITHGMFSIEATPRFTLRTLILSHCPLCLWNPLAPWDFSRPDLIDSALLRPGRLDKSLLCDIPSPNDRKEVCSFLSC